MAFVVHVTYMLEVGFKENLNLNIACGNQQKSPEEI